ncbi:MAG: TetR/AcrR family transcriptional regulator [Lachnospiraceae bacterium]|nr:TetR/AcrR family transcriptional regulator [Lachnospiraceae bacterium]
MNQNNTLERILICGKDFFLKYTFKSAPLRKIVEAAGVTTGAFYGYFANKEELFYALTDTTANGLMAILNSVANDMNNFPPNEKIFKMCDAYIHRIPEIVDYLLAHCDEMKLILACSQGTKYENYFNMLQERNQDNISQSAAIAEKSQQIQLLSPDTIELLMSGYFSMLAKLITEETDREKMIRSMTEVARVYQGGMLALMQAEADGDD